MSDGDGQGPAGWNERTAPDHQADDFASTALGRPTFDVDTTTPSMESPPEEPPWATGKTNDAVEAPVPAPANVFPPRVDAEATVPLGPPKLVGAPAAAAPAAAPGPAGPGAPPWATSSAAHPAPPAAAAHPAPVAGDAAPPPWASSPDHAAAPSFAATAQDKPAFTYPIDPSPPVTAAPPTAPRPAARPPVGTRPLPPAAAATGSDLPLKLALGGVVVLIVALTIALVVGIIASVSGGDGPSEDEAAEVED